MIFSLAKATTVFNKLSRPLADWLAANYNSAGQNQQRTQADNGLYGLLVSCDVARER